MESKRERESYENQRRGRRRRRDHTSSGFVRRRRKEKNPLSHFIDRKKEEEGKEDRIRGERCDNNNNNRQRKRGEIIQNSAGISIKIITLVGAREPAAADAAEEEKRRERKKGRQTSSCVFFIVNHTRIPAVILVGDIHVDRRLKLLFNFFFFFFLVVCVVVVVIFLFDSFSTLLFLSSLGFCISFRALRPAKLKRCSQGRAPSALGGWDPPATGLLLTIPLPQQQTGNFRLTAATRHSARSKDWLGESGQRR